MNGRVSLVAGLASLFGIVGFVGGMWLIFQATLSGLSGVSLPMIFIGWGIVSGSIAVLALGLAVDLLRKIFNRLPPRGD